MVSGNLLGHGAAYAAGASSASMQRALRRMSRDPADARVFSQAHILVPAGGISTAIQLVLTAVPASEYLSGQITDISQVIGPSVFLLVFMWVLSYGLFRRFGVDRDKVWTRFGHIFYREIRFDEVTRFNTGVGRYKLYSGKTMVNIDYNRFDYALVYLRLIEELHRRRFDLPDTPVDAPNWEEEAHIWRNVFAQKVYNEHSEFYENNPEALARLEALIEPATYPLGKPII